MDQAYDTKNAGEIQLEAPFEEFYLTFFPIESRTAREHCSGKAEQPSQRAPDVSHSIPDSAVRGNSKRKGMEVGLQSRGRNCSS